MATQTIEVSESVYQNLLVQADRLHISPEYLIERLVENVPHFLIPREEVSIDTADSSADIVNGLAAVNRLTTLFADLPLDDIEVHLHDPMLALANIELDFFPQ